MKTRKETVRDLAKRKEKSQKERRRRGKRQLQREMSRRYCQRVTAGISNDGHDENVEAEAETDELLNSPFSNRMVRKRQLDKVKEVLPSAPRKKVEIVASLASSPQTRKIVSKKCMLPTAEEEKEVLALKAMTDDLKEGMSRVKKDNSKTGRAAFGDTKALTFETNVKRRRAQKTLARALKKN